MKTVLIKNDEIHRNIKIISIEKNISMVDVVEAALAEYIKKNDKK